MGPSDRSPGADFGEDRGLESALRGFLGGRGGAGGDELDAVCDVQTVRGGRSRLLLTGSDASTEGLRAPNVLMASAVEKDGMIGEGARSSDTLPFTTPGRKGGYGRETNSTSGEYTVQSSERFDSARGGGSALI